MSAGDYHWPTPEEFEQMRANRAPAVQEALDYARRYWQFGREAESQAALTVLAAEVMRLRTELETLRETRRG